MTNEAVGWIQSIKEDAEATRTKLKNLVDAESSHRLRSTSRTKAQRSQRVDLDMTKRQLLLHVNKLIGETTNSDRIQFHSFDVSSVVDGDYLKSAGAGSMDFVHLGMGDLMNAIDWNDLCAQHMTTTNRDPRGNYQVNFGYPTGVSHQQRTEESIAADFGCVSPPMMRGTMLVKDIFVSLSEMARALGVEYACEETMKQKIENNPKQFKHMSYQAWKDRMRRFAKKIDERNIFEGLTIAFLPLDGNHAVKPHLDRHNCRMLSEVLVASNIIQLDDGSNVRVSLIGYMRKNIADFYMRRAAAAEVGTDMKRFYDELPTYRKFRADPKTRFVGAGSSGVGVGVNKQTNKPEMAHLLSLAAADKEVTFLSPVVHAIDELSREVSMTRKDAVGLLLLCGLCSNMLVFPTVIRTCMKDCWEERHTTPGGVVGLLVRETRKRAGSVIGGHHNRSQVSMTASHLDSAVLESSVQWLCDFCDESRRKSYPAMTSDKADEFFSSYCRSVKTGLSRCGLKGCGPFLVQHLVKVLAMSCLLQPLHILPCAVTVELKKDERDMPSPCPKASAYVFGYEDSDSKSKTSKLAVLQEMNLLFMRQSLGLPITPSAVENLRCEMYRRPRQKMDPFAPGQFYIELVYHKGTPVLNAHTIGLEDNGAFFVLTNEYKGPQISAVTDEAKKIPAAQNVKIPTGCGKSSSGKPAWEFLTLLPSDFPVPQTWSTLKHLFLGSLNDCLEQMSQLPGFEMAMRHARERKARSAKKQECEDGIRSGEPCSSIEGLQGASLCEPVADFLVDNDCEIDDGIVCTPNFFDCKSTSHNIKNKRDRSSSLTRQNKKQKAFNDKKKSDTILMTTDDGQWSDQSLQSSSVHKVMDPATQSFFQQHGGHIRCYPHKSNWEWVKHVGYNRVKNVSDLLNLPSSNLTKTPMSSYHCLAAEALASAIGRKTYFRQFGAKNIKCTQVRRNKRSQPDVFTAVLLFDAIRIDYSKSGECHICDEIAENLDGVKEQDNSGNMIWCFAGKHIAVDFVCLCVIFTAGKAKFYLDKFLSARKHQQRKENATKKAADGFCAIMVTPSRKHGGPNLVFMGEKDHNEEFCLMLPNMPYTRQKLKGKATGRKDLGSALFFSPTPKPSDESV